MPILKDLLANAELISDKFSTAPNYSRISEHMCDFDQREIRIGDAAYFVDPLFSSGVHFALWHAAAAIPLIKAAFDPKMPEQYNRELWGDYNQLLTNLARSFAVGIDQWYAEIARDKPQSVYWRHRGGIPTFDTRAETFQGLINGGIHGDLVQVITKGTNNVKDLGKEGALARTITMLKDVEPAPTARVRLKPNVSVKKSVTFEGGGKSGDGKPVKFVHGPYWDDPVGRAHETRPLYADPIECHRFFFTDKSSEQQVKFIDEEHHGLALASVLRDEMPRLWRAQGQASAGAAAHSDASRPRRDAHRRRATGDEEVGFRELPEK